MLKNERLIKGKFQKLHIPTQRLMQNTNKLFRKTLSKFTKKNSMSTEVDIAFNAKQMHLILKQNFVINFANMK